MKELEIHLELIKRPSSGESTEEYMERHIMNMAHFNDSAILRIKEQWNLVVEQIICSHNNKIIPEIVRYHVIKLANIFVLALQHNKIIGDAVMGMVDQKELTDILAENGLLEKVEK